MIPPSLKPVRRFITYVNFIRYDEPRIPDRDLFEPVCRQMELLRQAGLPCTWLLQFDALVAGPYVEYLKANAPDSHEMGLWLEINRMHCDAAGVRFRGRDGWNWDYHSNASLTVGYTQDERRALADAAVRQFTRTFGRKPLSVAAWYIDAFTLAYLAEHHGIEASANCKEQCGTDGYTLWGGIYGGAYYPSKRHALLPATNRDHQIDLPVFRMLGSDPINQYDIGSGNNGQRVMTLEPLCREGGADAAWLKMYLDLLVHSPALAMFHTQAGQENSFGWPQVAVAYQKQVAEIARRRNAGECEVLTLAEAGRWFRVNFNATPAQAIVALSDATGNGRQSIWYAGQDYRINLLHDEQGLRIRDLQAYQDDYTELYFDKTCPGHRMVADALPVIDGLRWSEGNQTAGGYVYLRQADGSMKPFQPVGVPEIAAEGMDGLYIQYHDADGVELHWRLNPVGWCVSMPSSAGEMPELLLIIRYSPAATETKLSVQHDSMVGNHHGFTYAMRIHGKAVLTAEHGQIVLCSSTGELAGEVVKNRVFPASVLG